MIKVGIVILNYNTPELTIELANMCMSYKNINYVVVVDNCSTDYSCELLKEKLKKDIILIQSSTNTGYACGNNIGLRKLIELKCDICIISNPDVRFERSLITKIINIFSNSKKYGILTSSRITEDGNTNIRQYWNLPKKSELILENLTLYSSMVKKRKEIYSVDKDKLVITIDVAPGAFFAIKSDLLKKINYLDSNTFLYFEENCLAMRTKQTYYNIGLITNEEYTCLSRKKNSTSKLQQSTMSRHYYTQSKEYFAKKYMHFNAFEFAILKFTDNIYIFEKWLSIKLKKIFREG